MSAANVLRVLAKDLRLGPRSPIFIWVLVLPLVFTIVLQAVFGSLFEPEPRLGIVDEGSSSITASAAGLSGIEVSVLGDAGELQRLVEANDLDAGLVLQAGFDEAIRSGGRPTLQFYVGGESLASNRIILSVTALDLVRAVESNAPPVAVEVVTLGEQGLPIEVRLVPLIMMYALVVAAVFLPAFSLADEREKGTLEAMIVTPVRLSEVVAAKGLLGVVLALAMTGFTLWLNQSLEGSLPALLVVLAMGSLICAEVGLIYGTASKNAMAVFALIKGTGVLLIGPTVFYVFPDWPQWIAKLFPTYWVINPIFEVTTNEADLADVAGDLLAAAGMVVLLAGPIVLLTRRLRTQLAAA